MVEDALLAQARQTAELMQQAQGLEQLVGDARTVLTAAAEDNAAYQTLLTNPELLGNYVNELFGPNGPYPTEIAHDRLAAEVAANERQYAAPQTFQRPQFEMPSPDVQAGSDDFWSVFSQVSDRNPAAAWQILSQATPEALRSKRLVSEN